ncbi:MAG: hypothetical protein WC850_00210 [Candidatus Gracilibacteria bacterium]
MRKNKLSIFILYLFFLLSFFFHLIKVDAFLDEDSGLDLYNNIDSGIYDLELKYYETNITNGGEISIAERINNLAGVPCIDESITMDDFNKIASGDTVTLSNLILDECKDDEGSQINISLMNNFFDVIIKLSKESQANAEEKTRITYNIARLGLYNDGNTDNSPYDIIKDLEDVNGIIFTLTNDTKYEGTDTTKLSDFFSSSKTNTNNTSTTNNNNTSTTKSNTNTTNTTTNTTSTTNNTNNTTNSTNTLNGYTCAKSSSNNLSGLNYSTLNILQNNIEDNGTSNYNSSSGTTQATTGNNNNGGTTASHAQIGGNLITISSPDINEDSSNCSDFFCIKILYSKYEQDLFGGGKSKDKSIEGLIKNSNNHLYKYANTSLIQHQITIDNWELSIKNLKLKDIFNQNFIVLSRNIPIMNVDKNNAKEKQKKENSPFGYKSLLEYYFKLYGLEYDRANSIDDFNKRLSETISINDSLGLGILNATERYDSSSNHATASKEDESYLNKLLSTKQRSDNISGLYGLFIELESFTNSFEQYVIGVNLQVISMAKKASW